MVSHSTLQGIGVSTTTQKGLGAKHFNSTLTVTASIHHHTGIQQQARN